jgi:hypothetical protein
VLEPLPGEGILPGGAGVTLDRGSRVAEAIVMRGWP